MIKWHADKKLEIYFSAYPFVYVRYPSAYMTEEVRREYIKKPFICDNAIGVKIEDLRKEKTYNFVIPENYCWDGASIPKAFWRIIGSKQDPRFLIPSMVHDYLCEHHYVVGNDRYLADRVFEKLLEESKVNPFQRWLMFHSVDNFQKFCKWGKIC